MRTCMLVCVHVRTCIITYSYDSLPEITVCRAVRYNLTSAMLMYTALRMVNFVQLSVMFV